jgi:acyl carrier protein
MSLDDFRLATQPKVAGTDNLVKAFENKSLGFFFMLSSIAGMLGMISQANYAAGNSFMDTLVQNKAAVGTSTTPFISVDFGPIDDTGIVADRTLAKEGTIRRGFVLLKLNEVPALIRYAIGRLARNEKHNQIVLGFDYKSIAKFDNTYTLKNPMFSHFSRLQERQTMKVDGEPVRTIQDLIVTAKDLANTEIIVSEGIARKISNLVAIDYGEIELQRRMAGFILDSLVIIELKSWVTQTFQARFQASEISDAANIKALASALASQSALTSKDLPMHNTAINDQNANRNGINTAVVPQKRQELAALPMQPLSDLDHSLQQFLSSFLPVLKPDARYEGYVNEICKPGGFGRKLQVRLSQLVHDPQVNN